MAADGAHIFLLIGGARRDCFLFCFDVNIGVEFSAAGFALLREFFFDDVVMFPKAQCGVNVAMFDNFFAAFQFCKQAVDDIGDLLNGLCVTCDVQVVPAI